MPDRVRSTLDDGVLTITLDCPDRLNAVTSGTLVRLLELLDLANGDDVRVVVVTGAGRAFSAGQDLQELDDDLNGPPDETKHHRQLAAYQAITDRVMASSKPFIAAVNGVAVGFGAELALACDVRIASDTARIGFVEATRGLFQTNGVMWLLPRVVGHGNAARMLLTGEILGADACLRSGLVSSVHPAAELPDAVAALARRIRDNAPTSVRLVKEVLGVSWTESREQVMQREVDGMLAVLRTEDLLEGTRAFLEGRSPAYTGR